VDRPRFVYVTYIASSPDKVWDALVTPDVTAKYWQHVNASDWRPGSRWEHRDAGHDAAVRIVGRVVECTPPRRLVVTWAFPQDEADESKHTLVTYEIEPVKGVVRLTVTHERLEPGSKMLEGITAGWPKVLSSLKSMLELGRPLPKLWE